MKILDKIVKDKKEEILKLSLKNPISSLENQKIAEISMRTSGENC